MWRHLQRSIAWAPRQNIFKRDRAKLLGMLYYLPNTHTCNKPYLKTAWHLVHRSNVIATFRPKTAITSITLKLPPNLHPNKAQTSQVVFHMLFTHLFICLHHPGNLPLLKFLLFISSLFILRATSRLPSLPFGLVQFVPGNCIQVLKKALKWYHKFKAFDFQGKKPHNSKRYLSLFSLNPGIVMTNLGSHLDLAVDYLSCPKSAKLLISRFRYQITCSRLWAILRFVQRWPIMELCQKRKMSIPKRARPWEARLSQFASCLGLSCLVLSWRHCFVTMKTSFQSFLHLDLGFS